MKKDPQSKGQSITKTPTAQASIEIITELSGELLNTDAKKTVLDTYTSK